MITASELLKPRYVVIGLYPGANKDIGDVFTSEHMESYYDRFPSVFRRLQWYEERKPEEMPEYIKSWNKSVNRRDNFSNVVIKTGEDIFWNSNRFSTDEKGFVSAYGGIVMQVFQPATREEYESQNKAQ